MNKEKFEKEFKERQQEAEKILTGYLPDREGLQKTIFDAMEYSLMAGGKRIRPILMREAYRLFGGEDMKVIEPFMAAIEMVHTYSLVHDDLPAMDNDDYRRGRKTTHVVYGEDMGILAGDALLNYAFETASQCFDHISDPMSAAKAMQIFAHKAGVYGMVGGQVVDVERTGQPLDKEVLEFIYTLKTGALLESALMVGAALAGADETALEQMEQIGRSVGMAFQIQDDILDVTSTQEELGKPIHSDEKNNKVTYVSLVGAPAAASRVKELSDHAVELLDDLDRKNGFLDLLVESLVSRRK